MGVSIAPVSGWRSSSLSHWRNERNEYHFEFALKPFAQWLVQSSQHSFPHEDFLLSTTHLPQSLLAIFVRSAPALISPSLQVAIADETCLWISGLLRHYGIARSRTGSRSRRSSSRCATQGLLLEHTHTTCLFAFIQISNSTCGYPSTLLPPTAITRSCGSATKPSRPSQ
jgi:hypothetical protein